MQMCQVGTISCYSSFATLQRCINYCTIIWYSVQYRATQLVYKHYSKCSIYATIWIKPSILLLYTEPIKYHTEYTLTIGKYYNSKIIYRLQKYYKTWILWSKFSLLSIINYHGRQEATCDAGACITIDEVLAEGCEQCEGIFVTLDNVMELQTFVKRGDTRLDSSKARGEGGYKADVVKKDCASSDVWDADRVEDGDEGEHWEPESLWSDGESFSVRFWW